MLPNTTYEFRIWANNFIGPGEIVSTIVTTLPEIGDEGILLRRLFLKECFNTSNVGLLLCVPELLRILMRDAKDFDTLVWFYAVGVVMTAMVLLGLTVCILLVRDCYEDDGLAGEWMGNIFLL